MNFGGFCSTRWITLVFLISLMFLTGCASMYVDGQTKDISASEFKKAEPPHPVQVLFEFQTKGTANAKATDLLKTQVVDQIRESGVFTEVSEGPVSGGALFSITLNNVPVTDDAFSKGFVTGMTFGLAGSKVTDGYVCTANYSGPNSAAPITKQARHAIHTTLGNTSAPDNATKAANPKEAITLVTHAVVSNVLNDVTHDPEFR